MTLILSERIDIHMKKEVVGWENSQISLKYEENEKCGRALSSVRDIGKLICTNPILTSLMSSGRIFWYAGTRIFIDMKFEE